MLDDELTCDDIENAILKGRIEPGRVGRLFAHHSSIITISFRMGTEKHVPTLPIG